MSVSDIHPSIMVRRREQAQLQQRIVDAVKLLCQKGLEYREDLTIDGLLGITLDNEEIVLFSISEKLRKHSLIKEPLTTEILISKDASLISQESDTLRTEPSMNGVEHIKPPEVSQHNDRAIQTCDKDFERESSQAEILHCDQDVIPVKRNDKEHVIEFMSKSESKLQQVAEYNQRRESTLDERDDDVFMDAITDEEDDHDDDSKSWMLSKSDSADALESNTQNEDVEQVEAPLSNVSMPDDLLDRQSAAVNQEQLHKDSAGSNVCNVCGAKFTRKTNLTRHMKLHLGTKLQCSMCSNSYTSQSDLKRHIDVQHRGIRFKCSWCNHQFKSKDGLRIHTKEHTKQHKYQCSLCNKGIATKSLYEAHMAKHQGIQPHKCECGRSYTHATNLRAHRKSCGISVGPFLCTKCGKAFRRKYYLTDHMRLHENPDKYQCPLCLDRFASNYSCQKHQENFHRKHSSHEITPHVNSGKERFQCTECGRSFSLKKTLKQHLSIHEHPDKHWCKFCDKRFRSLKYLKKHIALHKDPGKKQSCYTCGALFVSEAGLKKHIERKHPELIKTTAEPTVSKADVGCVFENFTYPTSISSDVCDSDIIFDRKINSGDLEPLLNQPIVLSEVEPQSEMTGTSDQVEHEAGVGSVIDLIIPSIAGTMSTSPAMITTSLSSVSQLRMISASPSTSLPTSVGKLTPSSTSQVQSGAIFTALSPVEHHAEIAATSSDGSACLGTSCHRTAFHPTNVGQNVVSTQETASTFSDEILISSAPECTSARMMRMLPASVPTLTTPSPAIPTVITSSADALISSSGFTLDSAPVTKDLHHGIHDEINDFTDVQDETYAELYGNL